MPEALSQPLSLSAVLTGPSGATLSLASFAGTRLSLPPSSHAVWKPRRFWELLVPFWEASGCPLSSSQIQVQQFDKMSAMTLQLLLLGLMQHMKQGPLSSQTPDLELGLLCCFPLGPRESFHGETRWEPQSASSFPVPSLLLLNAEGPSRVCAGGSGQRTLPKASSHPAILALCVSQGSPKKQP